MAKKRIISITVENEYVIGSGVVIGAAGSHDDVALSITFGEVWDGLTLQATFRDAKGENPTVIMILPSMLVAGTTRTYLVTIPVEAKRYEGKAALVLSGYTVTKSADGEGNAVYSEDTCTNTATAYFRVLPSDFALADDGSITPEIAKQLAQEIINVANDVKELGETFGETINCLQSEVDNQFEVQNEAIESLEKASEDLKKNVDGKVSSATVSHSNDILYGQSVTGKDTFYAIAEKPAAWCIPRYKSAGSGAVLKTGTPIQDNDCANKKYVDDGFKTVSDTAKSAADGVSQLRREADEGAFKGDKGDPGDRGPRGETGKPFCVAKVFTSVEEMQSGFETDGVEEGAFVVIETGDVENPDNSKLYVKGVAAYEFITDLSGSQGLRYVLTDEDREDIVASVIAALPKYSGEVSDI